MLWLGAAIPGGGLLLLPALLFRLAYTGDAVDALLWVFLAMYVFFLSIPAYAFGRAALGQQVHVRRQGSRVHVRFWFPRSPARELTQEADLHALTLEVRSRTRGLNPRVTLHEVTLNAPGFHEPAILHSGLTPWFARRAHARLSEQLGLDPQSPQAHAYTSGLKITDSE